MRVAKLFGGSDGTKQVKPPQQRRFAVPFAEWGMYWSFIVIQRWKGVLEQVAYAWAVTLGGDAGAQLLVKLGLVEQAIEYATEAGAFEHAFDLCRTSLKHKLPEVALVAHLLHR